ncbi:hypothetical protein OPQ81_002662 [Rhizoctonia solani]|nr:hypothetical protein OPQ81_002662 [Rhizoctonia solani]
MKTFAEGTWERPSKIILGIDIGTTESAVAFAYLYLGGPQSLHRKAVSFGAETRKPETEERAEEEQWQLARHFKLHLHPNALKHENNIRIEPLPTGVSLLSIYTDFMAYLLKHTREYFESRIIDGQRIWADYHEDMTVVLAHPNGWGLKEQTFLRQAAIAANYVASSKATSHIRFVSEAEASVHFCMLYGDLHNRLKPSTTFVVCDAGGSTIDTTTYNVKSASPMLEIEERKAPACVQAGGIFVDNEYEQHLARVLARVDLDEVTRNECLRRSIEDFKAFSKKEFDDVERQYRVDLGARRLRQEELGIKRGAIVLEGKVVETFFEKCIAQAMESVRQQISGTECRHILLVGGFGYSPYLRRRFLAEFGKNGCTVNIANESTAKAVADGAVIWCGKTSVTSRATRAAYGLDINVPYNPSDRDHYGRRIHRHAAGYEYLIHGWSQIIGQGIVVSADSTIRDTYWCSYRTPNPDLGDFKVAVFAYTGEENPGPWLRDPQGNLNQGFGQVCEIVVDLEAMRQSLKHRIGKDGDFYYLIFTIMFNFGSTELQASLEWEQDGKTLSIPATIVPSAVSNQ